LEYTVFEFHRKNKVNTLLRISRIFTNLGLYKTLYFVLSYGEAVQKVLFVWAFAKRPYIAYSKSDWLSD